MDEGESRRHSPRRPALDPPGRDLYLLEWRGEPMAGRSVRAVAIERFGYGVIARCGVRFVEQVVLGQRGCFQFGVGLIEPKALHALAGAATGSARAFGAYHSPTPWQCRNTMISRTVSTPPRRRW